MKRMGLVTIEEIKEMANGTQVRVGIIIPTFKEYITKKGDKMAFCTMEDMTGSGELTMLPNTYEVAAQFLNQDQPLLIKGKIDLRNQEDAPDDAPKEAKILAEEVSLLETAQAGCQEAVPLPVHYKLCTEEGLAELKAILGGYPGSAPVTLQLFLDEAICTLRLGHSYNIRPNGDFWKEFNQWRKNGNTTLQ